MSEKAGQPSTAQLVKGAFALAVIVVFAIGLIAILASGPTVQDGLAGQDRDFANRLQGHYGQMIDDEDWPSVTAAARQSCDRLTGPNPPPWAADLLVVEEQGAGKQELADSVARAGVDVYCPVAQPLVPSQP